MSARAYSLEEVHRQTSALPEDLLALSAPAAQAATAARRLGAPRRLVLLGSGDSLYASIAALPAFAAAGIRGRAMSGGEFLTRVPSQAVCGKPATVVGISASGGNPTVLEAMAAAGRLGHPTVAVTCAADGQLARAADTAVVLDPGPSAPSPGIRTYQATLLSLLHLAHAWGGADAGATAALDPCLLARTQRAVILGARAGAGAVARLLSPAPLVQVVSPVSALGTARYLAAKFSEIAGVPAMATDDEDWWHVHRFGHGVHHPVLFFLTPGPDRAQALEFARRTAARSPLIVVAADGDEEARAVGAVAVPTAARIAGTVRPLVDSAVAAPLALALARLLGRLPFCRN
ncbi:MULTISPECIES: SIS domain-containing protein [unclassified Streptomyces]|uniref:SIS domain-containing protein n=1 Tax=unclassified Streptomyces TaxID=2593676 RepID=UPI001318FEFC|nr:MULTISPECIES: SIS domain-containing protein [unclassified Streptomyces]QHC31822.1 SIS domain-containing protein [Streptomyces sp. HF10]WKE69201.1 SIS domain-containing protein [Streptomyces sp. WP-1]